MNRKKLILWIILGVTLGTTIFALIALSYVPISEEKHYFKPVVCENEAGTDSSGYIYLSRLLENDLAGFDSKKYLEKSSFCSPVAITRDLKLIEEYTGSSEEAEEFLYEVLCDSMKALNKSIWFEGFNPSELMRLVVVGEKYLYHKNIDPDHQYFYRGIHRFWFNSVSTHLEKLVFKDRTLKFDPDFRVLVSRCAQNNYHIAIKYSYTEKVAFYLSEGRYTYVWNRMWLKTHWLQKVGLIIWLVSTVAGYIMVSIWLYRRIRRTFAPR